MIWERLHCTWLLSGDMVSDMGETPLHLAAKWDMSNEYNGFLYDEMQGVAVVSSTLLAMDKKQKPFTRRPCIATFKAIRTALPGENDIILLGDFNLSPGTK
ncbi:hypothetical protein DPMN_172276, partial [Dreissena polymorpha]